MLKTFHLRLFAEVTALSTCTNSVNPLVNKGTGRTSTLTVQLMRCSGLSSCVMVRYARRFSSRLLSSSASSSPDWDRYLWRLQCSSNLHIQAIFHSALFSCKALLVVFLPKPAFPSNEHIQMSICNCFESYITPLRGFQWLEVAYNSKRPSCPSGSLSIFSKIQSERPLLYFRTNSMWIYCYTGLKDFWLVLLKQFPE